MNDDDDDAAAHSHFHVYLEDSRALRIRHEPYRQAQEKGLHPLLASLKIPKATSCYPGLPPA